MHDVEAVAAKRQNDKKTVQIAIRFEPDIIDRAEALNDALRERSEFKAFQMTRVDVLRMAIVEGLDALERKYESPKASRKRAGA